MRQREDARYTGQMPLPPPSQNNPRHASNPARVMLNSPLAAATRTRVYRQRTRQRPPERGLRVLGMVGAMLMHLLFLLAFVLGPAYPLQPAAPARQQFLQVRLIEPPAPPPPPPVRGTPPKERGPVHQGSRHQVAAVSERSANSETPTAVVTPAPETVAQPPAPAARPAPEPARPTPPSTPKPASAARPKATPPPAKPSPVPRPAEVAPPAPPKLQPEIVRKPQAEGNQPMPPPISLVMPKLALPSPRSDVPRMAPPIEMPRSSAPLSVMPAAVTPPASAAPEINLQADLMAAEPIATPALPQPKPAVAPLANAVPKVAASSAEPAPAPAESTEKIQAIAVAALPAVPPVMKPAVLHPSLSAPTSVAELAPAAEAPAAAKSSASPTSPQAALAGAGPADASRAPDAIAQGSDTATPGQVNGVVAAPTADSSAVATAVPPASGQGRVPGQGEHSPGAGQAGGNQPGAEHGEPHGAIGDYVQVRPQGDTKIMNHGVPNIGYQATRFEKDWTPENESSVDTALRRAVEKTTVKHTFHLPQGIRVECAVMPLLPMSLLGCHNPDPPPQPVADKVYDRLHLAPANPVATPAPVPNPATTATSAPATVKFDNSAECAAARVAGGPPPPGCGQPVDLPAKPLRGPASSSSSWVPASDQFH